MDKPQIVEWALPTELTPRIFEQLWALPTLLKIAVIALFQEEGEQNLAHVGESVERQEFCTTCCVSTDCAKKVAIAVFRRSLLIQ